MENLAEIREKLEAHPKLRLVFLGRSDDPDQPRPRFVTAPPAPLLAVFGVEGHERARVVAGVSREELVLFEDLYSPPEVAAELLERAEGALTAMLTRR